MGMLEDAIDIRPTQTGVMGKLDVQIKWKDMADFEASWEDLDSMIAKFPDSHLGDKADLLRGYWCTT